MDDTFLSDDIHEWVMKTDLDDIRETFENILLAVEKGSYKRDNLENLEEIIEKYLGEREEEALLVENNSEI